MGGGWLLRQGCHPMLGQDPGVLDLGVVVRLVEYEVVPDPPPVDVVQLKMKGYTML